MDLFGETIAPTLVSYLSQTPILLVWLVGFVGAAIRWQRHPKVSLYIMIAIAVLFLQSIIMTWVNIWLPLTLQENGMALQQIGVTIAGIGFVNVLISAVAWVLILLSVFGWRQT